MHKFFSAHRRKSVPASFVFHFYMPPNGRAYYLKALVFSKKPISWNNPPRIKLDGPPPEDKAEQIHLFGNFYSDYMYSLHGDLDRKANTVEIGGTGVSKFKLYVYHKMFDLEKPVTIKYPGKTWTGRIPASARCALKHYFDTRNAELPVVNEIILEKDRGPEILYKNK